MISRRLFFMLAVWGCTLNYLSPAFGAPDAPNAEYEAYQRKVAAAHEARVREAFTNLQEQREKLRVLSDPSVLKTMADLLAHEVAANPLEDVPLWQHLGQQLEIANTLALNAKKFLGQCTVFDQLLASGSPLPDVARAAKTLRQEIESILQRIKLPEIAVKSFALGVNIRKAIRLNEKPALLALPQLTNQLCKTLINGDTKLLIKSYEQLKERLDICRICAPLKEKLKGTLLEQSQTLGLLPELEQNKELQLQLDSAHQDLLVESYFMRREVCDIEGATTALVWASQYVNAHKEILALVEAGTPLLEALARSFQLLDPHKFEELKQSIKQTADEKVKGLAENRRMLRQDIGAFEQWFPLECLKADLAGWREDIAKETPPPPHTHIGVFGMNYLLFLPHYWPLLLERIKKLPLLADIPAPVFAPLSETWRMELRDVRPMSADALWEKLYTLIKTLRIGEKISAEFVQYWADGDFPPELQEDPASDPEKLKTIASQVVLYNREVHLYTYLESFFEGTPYADILARYPEDGRPYIVQKAD